MLKKKKKKIGSAGKGRAGGELFAILNKVVRGNSLAVQRLGLHASTAGGEVSGEGTEIPHAAWCGQRW